MERKSIAIISTGYLWFPCELGTSRFFDIAMHFVNACWEVECITTSFQHFEKKARDQALIISQRYPFRITFIDALPYKKNVGPGRILSNALLCENLKKYLKTNIDHYDAVYVSIPPNNISKMVTDLAKKHHIPVVVDIEDLWPEAMSMVVQNQFIKDVFFKSFYDDAEKTYQNASGIIGTSKDYTIRAFKNQKRDIPAETIYVGCNLAAFDQGVKEFYVEKPADEFWVAYAGSISTSYDIKTLVDAVSQLKEKNIHAIIMGTGSAKEELEHYSKKMDNIHFLGFMEYGKMASILSSSDIVINSFIKGAPQSIVNKIGDYLASGKPMINTLENQVFCELVEKEKVGVNIEPENIDALKKAIVHLKDHSGVRQLMGENARRLCEEEFDRSRSYDRIVKMVDEIVEKNDIGLYSDI